MKKVIRIISIKYLWMKPKIFRLHMLQQNDRPSNAPSTCFVFQANTRKTSWSLRTRPPSIDVLHAANMLGRSRDNECRKRCYSAGARGKPLANHFLNVRLTSPQVLGPPCVISRWNHRIGHRPGILRHGALQKVYSRPPRRDECFSWSQLCHSGGQLPNSQIPRHHQNDLRAVITYMSKHSVIANMDMFRGMRCEFLPPYSPDYNPIELAFSAIKADFRHHLPALERGTMTDIQREVLVSIHDSVFSITSEDACGWFRRCGY
jgi:hypothetical protein